EARSGYRFIAPAQAKLEPNRALSVATEPVLEALPKRRVLLHWQLAAALAFLVIVAAAAISLRLPSSSVSFKQITFRRGQVSSARCSDGSRKVLYTAQGGDEPRRMYEAHVGDPVSRALGFEGLSLMAVSRLGELAVMRSDGTMNIRGGTLSRVTASGGPIQEVAENIFGVDWSS